MLSGILQSGWQTAFFKNSFMNITVIGVPSGTGKSWQTPLPGMDTILIIVRHEGLLLLY